MGGDWYKIPVQQRLDKFREKAVPLVTRVCKKAIEDSGLTVDDIGKLVVVSSTGFIGPGLDCHIIQEVGLNRGVDRALIGFMGCAAAMNGFRVGMDYCRSHEKAALVCCVELSSVHTTFDDNINDSILHAIFGDGCACAVLKGCTAAEAPKGAFAIVDDHAWLMEGTEDGITLSINEKGISCKLSKYLPQYIAKNMKGYIDGFTCSGHHEDDLLPFEDLMLSQTEHYTNGEFYDLISPTNEELPCAYDSLDYWETCTNSSMQAEYLANYV